MLDPQERDSIHVSAQKCSGILDGEHILVAQLTTGIERERTLGLEPRLGQLGGLRGLPRIGLFWHEQPDVGFGDACLDGLFGRVTLRLGLLVLEWIEVECDAIGADRFPGQVLAHALFEFLYAIAVSREKYQGVAIAASAVAAMIQHIPRGADRLALLIFEAVRTLRFEHDQPHRPIVIRHMARRRWTRVDAREVATSVR